MNSLKSPRYACYDPVSMAIEAHLRNVGAVFQCELKINGTPPEYQVSFGDATATAESYDLAFVRLASKLLADSRFNDSLTAVLRGTTGLPSPA